MGTDLNIGHVTAYAYAKSKGYTGTEEQFATELAQFAQNAQKVAEDRAAVEQLVDEFLNTTAPAVIQDVTDEGTSQVERVANAGTAQVTRVGEAGNTQIDAVGAAGTTQIGLVTAEGTTQVTRVQDKGDEVIDSIPADYTALTEEVSDLNRQLSDVKSATNSLEERMAPIDGIITMPSFENGSVYANNGVLEYSNNLNRIRMPRNTYLLLEQGDEIHMDTGYTVGVNYSTDDGATYVWEGVKGNEYIVPSTARYVLFIQSQNEITDVKETESHVTITKSSSFVDDTSKQINDVKNAMNQTIGVVAISANKYFDTDGKTELVSNRRMINTFPVVISPFSEISIDVPYRVYWYAFDRDMTLLSNSEAWVSNIKISALPANSFYINFTIRNENATTSDISNQIDTIIKSISVIPAYNEQIKMLSELIEPVGSKITVEMEQGGFDDNGIPLTALVPTRLRSKNFIPIAYLYNLITELKSNTELSYQVVPIYYADNTGLSSQVGRESGYIDSPAKVIVPYENAKFAKLYVKNSSNTTILPSDVTITCSCVQAELDVNSYTPTVAQTKMYAVQKRINGQDIAVYNGNIFDFGEGVVSVNGGANVSITNAHGNNCCFGDTLHGDFPYLYCAPWNGNENNIYVNQYTNGSFTLVNTITYSSISGILNACVDESNNRVYMFNVISTAEVGTVNFVVADLSGSIISTKQIDPIPVIEGITLYKGVILVSSGHGIGYPNYIHVFDTEGNLLSKTQENAINIKWNNADVIEGIDIDKVTGELYIGTTKLIVKN